MACLVFKVLRRKSEFCVVQSHGTSFNILFILSILWMHGWLNKWFRKLIFLLFQIRPWSSKQRIRVLYSILFFGILKGRLGLRIVLFRKYKSFSITASFVVFASKIYILIFLPNFFTILRWKNLNLVTLQSKVDLTNKLYKAVNESKLSQPFVVSEKKKPPDRSSQPEWWWWDPRMMFLEF